MDFPDLFKLLKEKGRVDLIDPIEDFRDAVLEKTRGKDLTQKQLVELINKDRELLDLVKRITKEGNVRKVVLKMAIKETARP